MMQLFHSGGVVMAALFFLSLIGLSIFLERLFHYHRAQIRADDFLRGIFNVLRAGNRLEAVTLCEETPGPVAKLVHAALLHIEDGPERIDKAMEDAGLMEIPRLERRLPLLAGIGALAPMLGLLGTILGLLKGLEILTVKAPLIHSGDLASGLWQALLTTAFGLGVALPAYAGYNLLLARVDSLLLDMEHAAREMRDRLSRRHSAEPVESA